jgi:DNA-binding transcriptional LysR family regulator
MDRLTSMAVFVKAVDLGSFAAAGDALALSAPMVGKHVRFLEERLGARLLNRTTRRQSLTDFGRAYYERCRIVLAEAEAADALAAEQRSEPQGRLRVAMSVHFGRRCVTPILLELAQRYPKLELDLFLSDRLIDLTEGEHDLAIRTGALEDSASLTARRVAQQRMAVCAAPSYLKQQGKPSRIEDLTAHDAIIYRRSARISPWRFPQSGAEPVEVTPAGRLRLDDLDAIADAAVAGMGLAWLPIWLIRDRLAAGTLVTLLPKAPSYLYDVTALWLQTPHLPLKVRLAIDALVKELPKLMD